MTTRSPIRPPTAYIHGEGRGIIIIVPGRVCALLEKHARLNEVRVDNRGQDPEFDAVLNAMRFGALAWRGSVTGTTEPPPPEPEQRLMWLSTTEAANRLNLTDRAIRKAIAEKKLHADQVDGRWRIRIEDFEHYRAARAA